MDLEDFTQDDIDNGGDVLGPAYFAARRVAESLMNGVESEPLAKVVKKCADEMTQGIYQYVEDGIRGDLEHNLHNHINNMVNRTVQALLTGEEWAMNLYPLSKYHDGEKIRAAVCKHGGDAILSMRIVELEKEIERLKESISWMRR